MTHSTSTTFYKETNLQETIVGKIPKDWRLVKIVDVISLEYGKALPSKDRALGSYPVMGSHGVIGYHNKPYVNGPGIIVGRKGTIGAVSWIDEDFWPIDTTYYVKTRKKDIILKWLFYELEYANLSELRLSDVVPGLKRDLVYLQKIPLPSSKEQKEIAEILSYCDTAIQKTDEVIAKTGRLKMGLMQQLLTKGIGHKEFKETKIGKMPKSWKVLFLERACKEITDGSHWSPKEVEKSTYRIATIANLKEKSIDISSCKFISKEDFKRLLGEGDVPRNGDILLSKDGTVGISFAFQQDPYNVALLSSIAIIRPNFKLLNSHFGAYVFKSPYVYRQLVGRITGTAIRRIILRNIRMLRIPIPPLIEQEKIAEVLLAIDKKLEFERKEKVKLERIIQSLKDLLLSGKVRVRMD